MSNLFFALALMSVACGILACIMIASFLSSRGVKVNYLFFRVLMFRYIRQYRNITVEETGKPGAWFYAFVTAMNLSLLLAAIGIVLRITAE